MWNLWHVYDLLPLHSSWQCPSNYDCLEDKRESYQNCSVLYCIWRLYTLHGDKHIYEQFLKLTVGSGFLQIYVCFLPVGSCVVSFCCIRFCFFSTKPTDWLGRTSPTWPIFCQVGRKTLTQSFWLSCQWQADTFLPCFDWVSRRATGL